MNLTPLGILALVAAALLGVVGTWSDALGTFPWWRLVVVWLVVGLTFEFLAVRGHRVHARWRSAGRLFLGRPETLELELGGEPGRRLTLRALPVLPDGISPADVPAADISAGGGFGDGSDDRDALEPIELRVSPGGCAAAGVGVRPLRLGTHAWPTLPVRVLGPLGLAWWSRTVDPRTTSIVLPDTLGRRSVAAGSAEAGTAPRPRVGSGRELHQLREYRPGDPRNAIDWKATARSSKLMTRVYSEDQHLEIMILLDAGRTSRTEIDGMSQLGHYANLAARFAEYCSSGDDRVGLVVFADRPLRVLPPGGGLPGVVRIRRALAELEPRAVESDPIEAALSMWRVVRHRCLAVVLSDLYEPGSTQGLAAAAALLAQKHLPMIVGLVGSEVAALAAADARHWLDPYRALAASGVKRQVSANVARLTEQGALALAARPAELDGKVLEHYRRLRARHRI